MEAAAGGRIEQRRRLARDLVQAVDVDVELRQRSMRPHVYGWRGSLKIERTPPPDDPSGVHHDHVVGGLGDDAEVVGVITAEP
jgi:hypothetical protein